MHGDFTADSYKCCTYSVNRKAVSDMCLICSHLLTPGTSGVVPLASKFDSRADDGPDK